MKTQIVPLEEPASRIQPGEICLLDNVPHKRLKDGGPIDDRRGLLPFLVGDTIEWIHADTKVQPRRKISVDKVPIGVGFLLNSGAEYVRVEIRAGVCDGELESAAEVIQRTLVLAMQVSTGQIFSFKPSEQVTCVEIVAIVHA